MPDKTPGEGQADGGTDELAVRRDAVRAYDIFGAAPEPALDDLARLVRLACGVRRVVFGFFDGPTFRIRAQSGEDLPDSVELAGTNLTDRSGTQIGAMVLYAEPGSPTPDHETIASGARQAAAFLEARLQAIEVAGERRRFRTLLDILPEHIVTMRGEHLVYEFVNDSFLKFSGLESSQVLGLAIREAWNVPEAHVQLLRHVYRSGETFGGVEEPVWSPPQPGKPSTLGYYDFKFQPLRDDRGDVEGVLVYSLDVTEKVLAQRNLAESEERFRTVFDSAADDAMIVMDGDRRIIAWNRAAERICGWTAEEAIGQSADIIFTPEQRASGLPAEEAARAGAEGKAIDERWHLRKDGGRFWASGTMNALHHPDGAVRGFLKVFRDATQRMRETRTLAFLRELTESVLDLRDPTEIVKCAERMLGEHLQASRCAYAEVEVDEDTFTILEDWSPDLPSSTGTYRLEIFGPRALADQRSGRTLVVNHVDAELAPHEGGDMFRSISIQSIVCCPLIKEGRLAAMMAVHQEQPRTWETHEIELIQQVADRMWSEIERARAERSLRALNEELEARVAERTNQLEIAIKEAEAFNYSISHDLRAPIRAIISTASILLEEIGETLSESHRALLERQAHNGKRLGKLVDDLLNLSRLSRAPLHRARIDMSSLSQDVAAELARAGMAGTCRIDIQPAMSAEGDERLIRLVLSNLLQNACKFSPSGGDVLVRQEGEIFSVRDQGVGFDMRFAGKVFLPFERLVNEREFPGTGIGLASVERIVRRHGGRVWAESEPGRGSTFFFTLG